MALSYIMRSLLILVLSAFLAQRATAQDSTAMALARHLKALPEQPTDAGRDSLSNAVSAGLRTLLSAPDGLTRSFEGIPISKVDAPDGSFRLVTWNVPLLDGTHRYHGMLLRADRKGAQLIELRDGTAGITAPEVPELGADRWYGAVYYQVVPVRKGGKTYFTLLGWKGYSKVETRKVIDVLHFKGAQARFGAPLFGTGRLRATRKVFGYGFQSTMMLRHEPEAGRIVLDHLSPVRPDLEGQWAFYGPDLSYDAYVWDKDHWRFERDIDARDMRRNDRPFKAPPSSPRP